MMANPIFAKYEVTPELAEKALQALETARNTGKVKKGTNEVTKMVERGHAKLVLIAGDVTPPEVVIHLPMLCEEKGIPVVVINTKAELGSAAGLQVGSSAACVVEVGDAKDQIEDLSKKLKERAK